MSILLIVFTLSLSFVSIMHTVNNFTIKEDSTVPEFVHTVELEMV